MKGIWSHIRAIDVLESLPEVDRERIGCMGWSLGGYNTVFLGQFEPRIKAMVSHAGYNSFFDYAASPYGGGDLRNWSLDKHFRRIRTVYNNDPRQLPCDFPEMIATLAPRPFLTIAPLHDHIFVLPGVRKCLDAARPIYELLGAGNNLQTRFPDGKHEFAKADREAAYAFLDQFLRPKP
jgi:dienelactone hydrolase